MVAPHPGRSGALRVPSRSLWPPPGCALHGRWRARCLFVRILVMAALPVGCEMYVQLFRIWAERRRIGPQPGVELTRELFVHTPAVWGEVTPFDEYLPSVLRRAVGGVRGLTHGLATIALVAGVAEPDGRLSVANTEDLVWFLARAAFILTWMDTDRIDREDTTMVLPVMPLCLDVVKMATRCIYLGTGLPTKVVWRLMDAISTANAEIEVASHLSGWSLL
jgi:hypothetical protein